MTIIVSTIQLLKKYSTRDGYMLLPLADFGFRLVSLKIWTYFIMLIVRYLIVFLNHEYATSGVDVIMMEGQHGLFLSCNSNCILETIWQNQSLPRWLITFAINDILWSIISRHSKILKLWPKAHIWKKLSMGLQNSDLGYNGAAKGWIIGSKGCIIHRCCDFSIIHWIAILTSAETSPIQNVRILNWERDSWKGWKS